MAAILNPNAPLFLPTTAFETSNGEVSLIYSPCRPSLPQPFPAIIPNHCFISKGAIFLHPSIFYTPPFPQYSFYVSPHPPAKNSEHVLIEREASEVSNGEVQEVKVCDEQNMRMVTASRFAAKGLRGRHGCRNKRSSPSQGYHLWVRKDCSGEINKANQDGCFDSSEDLQFCEADGKTTVMIKNIPNKLSRPQLLELLDLHCRIENQSILGGKATFSEFDFVYLPMDFISGNNLGYAFVNFTSSSAATKIYQDLHMKSWNKFGSRKICEISHAKIQGLEELVKHFRRSIFNCPSPEYLPLLFEPSRDGSRSSAEHLVGRFVQRNQS